MPARLTVCLFLLCFINNAFSGTNSDALREVSGVHKVRFIGYLTTFEAGTGSPESNERVITTGTIKLPKRTSRIRLALRVKGNRVVIRPRVRKARVRNGNRKGKFVHFKSYAIVPSHVPHIGGMRGSVPCSISLNTGRVDFTFSLTGNNSIFSGMVRSR